MVGGRSVFSGLCGLGVQVNLHMALALIANRQVVDEDYNGYNEHSFANGCNEHISRIYILYFAALIGGTGDMFIMAISFLAVFSNL